MKKKLIICISAFVCLLALSIGITYAWYVSQNRVDVLDPSTNGIIYSYKIDGEDVINDHFDVQNVAFFDVDSTIEGKYLTGMAVKVGFEISNVNSTAVKLIFEQELEAGYESAPHIACIFSTDDELDSASDDIEYDGTVVDYAATIDSSIYENYEVSTVAAGEKITVYAYIFGVQPDDAANNEFLSNDNTYAFNIKISAVQIID